MASIKQIKIGSTTYDLVPAKSTTITLTGDVTGSATLIGDGTAVSISTTVADDSHNHTIANVDNLQTTLNAKAPLASPALTGTPTAPTAAAGTNTTQIATTAFVQTALASVGGGTSIAVSSTQPTGQSTGDFWYKIL